VCLRSNEWKLICTANGDLEPVGLYHIAQDPGESRNRLDDEPEIVDTYFDRLIQLLEEDQQRYVTADRLDSETRGHLEDLGYL
jgi:arylsulfatase A-like enzyme